MSNSKTVDLSKPVQTMNGNKVAIHTTNGRVSNYPVIGEMKEKDKWWTCTWSLEGKCSQRHDGNNLVNVPEKHKIWVSFVRLDEGRWHVYTHGEDYDSKSFHKSRLVATKEVEFTEGEGLE